MVARPSSLDWFLFGLISVFWGSSYLFIKIGVETLQPFTLIAGRLFFGSLVLGAALLVVRAPLPRDRGTYAKLLFMAVVNIVVPFSAHHLGRAVHRLVAGRDPPGHDTAVHHRHRLAGPDRGGDHRQPPDRADHRLRRGRRPVQPRPDRRPGRLLLGELALVLSSLSYAVGSVFVRVRMRGFHPTVPAFFQVSIAFLIILVLTLVFESPVHLPDTARAWFAVVWLGVFGSSLAYLIYFRLVHVLGATRISLITYVMPIVGIIAGVLVLNETIDIRTVVGAAIILAGVGLVNSHRASRTLYRRSAVGDDGRASTGDDDRPPAEPVTQA